MGVRFSRGVLIATYLNGREPGSDPGSGSSTLPVAVLGFGVPAMPPSSNGSDTRFSAGRYGFEFRRRYVPQYPIGKGGRFESEQVGNDEWDRHLPVALYGACPGGEEAVLKTVGLKRFAGSNPVCSAKCRSDRKVLYSLGKRWSL